MPESPDIDKVVEEDLNNLLLALGTNAFGEDFPSIEIKQSSTDLSLPDVVTDPLVDQA